MPDIFWPQVSNEVGFTKSRLGERSALRRSGWEVPVFSEQSHTPPQVLGPGDLWLQSP